MIFAALASLLALMLIGLLMIDLICYAFPLAIGLAAGQWADAAGLGLVFSIGIGLGAAMLTMILARIALGLARSPFELAAIGLLFAIPAGLAGYHASLGLWALFAQADYSAHILASFAAIGFGALAWTRLPHIGGARPT